jgi:hypothetical protein
MFGHLVGIQTNSLDQPWSSPRVKVSLKLGVLAYASFASDPSLDAIVAQVIS